MKLLRATQSHMVPSEIVSHCFALFYEIRSHYIFLKKKQYEFVLHVTQFYTKNFEIVSQFILTVQNVCSNILISYINNNILITSDHVDDLCSFLFVAKKNIGLMKEQIGRVTL